MRRETDAQKIKRLEREKEALLVMLHRYMPASFVVPPTREYAQWKLDNKRLRAVAPGWPY